MWVARVALGVVSSTGRVRKGEGEGGSALIDGKEAGEEKAEVWTPTLAHYAGYTEREIPAGDLKVRAISLFLSPRYL
jgi:hypothetical protein